MSLAKITKLRKELTKRWKELDLKTSDIIRDANERGRKLHAAQMSRYIKGEKGGPSEEDLLWLSWRWGIPVQIVMGHAVVNGNKVNYEVRPYNEAECLEALKKVFR